MSRWFYAVILAISLIAILWCIVLYQITPSVFSDIEIYGIKHEEDVYTAIVETSQHQITVICAPLITLLVIALIGWGSCVTHIHRKKSDAVEQASGAN